MVVEVTTTVVVADGIRVELEVAVVVELTVTVGPRAKTVWVGA